MATDETSVGRIEKFYERRFQELLGADGAQVKELFARASKEAHEHGIKLSFALALLLGRLRRERGETDNFPRHFVCDAGLGGLARWLRGAGYAADWPPHLDDAAVIREAQQQQATLLTTDSLMMERGVLRDGLVPSVFVPPSVNCEAQLVIVLNEMGLLLRDSRCMKCGGELRRVEKQSVADRIPPRTARWLDEYFLCVHCNQLFWRGTHWKRITAALRELVQKSAT